MAPAPGDGTPPVDLSSLLRERDLYRKLLELGGEDEVEPFLEEALALAVEAAGARRGYLELRDESAGPEDGSFWIARGCSEDDLAGIRAAFSRGVIAAAIATRQTIITASALADPRFRERGTRPAGPTQCGIRFLVDSSPVGPGEAMGEVNQIFTAVPFSLQLTGFRRPRSWPDRTRRASSSRRRPASSGAATAPLAVRRWATRSADSARSSDRHPSGRGLDARASGEASAEPLVGRLKSHCLSSWSTFAGAASTLSSVYRK